MSLDQDKVAEVVNKTYAAYVAARDLGDEHLMELTEAVWMAATSKRREEATPPHLDTSLSWAEYKAATSGGQS